MDRSTFGRFGHDLTEDEFAKALAAAGVLAATGTSLALPVEDLRLHLGWAVQHKWAIVPWASPALKKVLDRADAGALAEAWYSAVVVRQRAPRIEVSLGGRTAGTRIDPWLLSTLSLPSVGAAAVYALIDRAPVEAAFNWPLRFGFFGDATARTFGASIFQAGYFNELIAEVPEGEQPDLIVAPHDLRLAVSAAPAEPQRKADCVLLLGGLGIPRENAAELLESLRHSIATAGVAVMDVPPERRVGAALDVVAELAHDHPLDVTLFEVGRRYGVEPLLVASRALVEGARLSGFAKRFGREMAALGSDTLLSIPPEAARSEPLEQLQGPAERLGLELASRSEWLDYRRENNAAHDLARMRRAMEPHLGDATRPLPPAPAPRPPRYVQAELRDAEKHRVTRALEPGGAYCCS